MLPIHCYSLLPLAAAAEMMPTAVRQHEEKDSDRHDALHITYITLPLDIYIHHMMPRCRYAHMPPPLYDIAY